MKTTLLALLAMTTSAMAMKKTNDHQLKYGNFGVKARVENKLNNEIKQLKNNKKIPTDKTGKRVNEWKKTDAQERKILKDKNNLLKALKNDTDAFNLIKENVKIDAVTNQLAREKKDNTTSKTYTMVQKIEKLKRLEQENKKLKEKALLENNQARETLEKEIKALEKDLKLLEAKKAKAKKAYQAAAQEIQGLNAAKQEFLKEQWINGKEAAIQKVLKDATDATDATDAIRRVENALKIILTDKMSKTITQGFHLIGKGNKKVTVNTLTQDLVRIVKNTPDATIQEQFAEFKKSKLIELNKLIQVNQIKNVTEKFHKNKIINRMGSIFKKNLEKQLNVWRENVAEQKESEAMEPEHLEENAVVFDAAAQGGVESIRNKVFSTWGEAGELITVRDKVRFLVNPSDVNPSDVNNENISVFEMQISYQNDVEWRLVVGKMPAGEKDVIVNIKVRSAAIWKQWEENGKFVKYTNLEAYKRGDKEHRAALEEKKYNQMHASLKHELPSKKNTDQLNKSV